MPNLHLLAIPCWLLALPLPSIAEPSSTMDVVFTMEMDVYSDGSSVIHVPRSLSYSKAGKVVSPFSPRNPQSTVYIDEFEAPAQWMDWERDLLLPTQKSGELGILYRNSDDDPYYWRPSHIGSGRQALALRVTDFHPQESVQIHRVLFQTANYSRYDLLKLIVHGGDGDPSNQANLSFPEHVPPDSTVASRFMMFVRFAAGVRDTSSYFGLRFRLYSGMAELDLDYGLLSLLADQLTELRTDNAPSGDIQFSYLGEYVPLHYDRQNIRVTVEKKDVSYIATGEPSATDIQTVWLGLENAGDDMLEGDNEVWVEEISLRDNINNPLTADFNGDGAIGFADFLQFAEAYGKQQGDPGYSESFDLNYDNKIEFEDFLLFVSYYGMTAQEEAQEFRVLELLPQLVRSVAPEYPEIARKAGLEGPVTLRFRVGRDGRVTQVVVVSGQEIFQQATMDAVYQFLFRPAIQNGQPVSVWVAQTITFWLV